MFLVTVFVMMNLKCVNSESETTLPQEIHQNKEEGGEYLYEDLPPKELGETALGEQAPLLYGLTTKQLQLLGELGAEPLEAEKYLEKKFALEVYEVVPEGQLAGEVLGPLPTEQLLEAGSVLTLEGQLELYEGLLYTELLKFKGALEASAGAQTYKKKKKTYKKYGTQTLIGKLKQLGLYGQGRGEPGQLDYEVGLKLQKSLTGTKLLLGGKLGLLYELAFGLYALLKALDTNTLQLGLQPTLTFMEDPAKTPFGTYLQYPLEALLATLEELATLKAFDAKTTGLIGKNFQLGANLATLPEQYLQNLLLLGGGLGPQELKALLGGGLGLGQELTAGLKLQGLKGKLTQQQLYELGKELKAGRIRPRESRSLLENESESKLEDINDEKTTRKASHRDI